MRIGEGVKRVQCMRGAWCVRVMSESSSTRVPVKIDTTAGTKVHARE